MKIRLMIPKVYFYFKNREGKFRLVFQITLSIS